MVGFLYWEMLILMVGNIPMLRVSVRSCSFLFYPPVDVRPCGWCRSVLCCDVRFVCAAGSVTVLTVGCCYAVDCVFVCCVKLVLHCNVAVHCNARVLLIGFILRIAIPLL